MSITSAFCNSYKTEIFAGTHTSSHTYKIALFTNSATLNKNTTTYTGVSNEVVGAGYTAGGQTLVGFTVSLDGDTAILDWTTDPTWVMATITARGALIYNSSLAGKNSVCVLDFSSDRSSVHATFTVELPLPSWATGLVRIK